MSSVRKLIIKAMEGHNIKTNTRNKEKKEHQTIQIQSEVKECVILKALQV